MTALTSLQSRPATAQPFTTAGNVRQCYERLLQGPDDSDKQAEAKAFLKPCIEQAAALPQEMPDDPAALLAWVEQHSAGVARQYADYLERRKGGGRREFFHSKAQALYFLQAVAPTKLVDGAWLYGVLRHWHDHRFEGLLCTYLEELGDGVPAQNHVVLYRKLLAEHGLSDMPDIHDDRYLQGAVQLALGYAGDEYLPEIIGYNLGYEQLPLHLLISAYELSELDIDPYYFTLHVTIDNASTGHAHKAVQSLLQLMPMEADRESFWRRVTLGYRLNDLGQGSRAVIESFDLEREVLDMLERKRPFGQHMHSDYCKFEGKTVNQWLAEPGQLEGFLKAMQDKGWIRRHEDPQNSRFWTLIEGAGAAMFGVFSPYEKQLLHDWIAGDWLEERGRPGARRSLGAAQDTQAPAQDPDVQNLQQLLRGKAPDAQMQILMPWLSPRCHSHPAGLLATRRFIELKSALR